MTACVKNNPSLFPSLPISVSETFQQSSLNAFMSLGKPVWQSVRRALTELLSSDLITIKSLGLEGSLGSEAQFLQKKLIVPMASASLFMPFMVGDYTDFYASRSHATNVGTMFRGKENALMPNW
jgi:fumarylacetoacetase